MQIYKTLFGLFFGLLEFFGIVFQVAQRGRGRIGGIMHGHNQGHILSFSILALAYLPGRRRGR